MGVLLGLPMGVGGFLSDDFRGVRKDWAFLFVFFRMECFFFVFWVKEVFMGGKGIKGLGIGHGRMAWHGVFGFQRGREERGRAMGELVMGGKMRIRFIAFSCVFFIFFFAPLLLPLYTFI